MFSDVIAPPLSEVNSQALHKESQYFLNLFCNPSKAHEIFFNV